MKIIKRFWKATSIVVSIVMLASLLMTGSPVKAISGPIVTLDNPLPGQDSKYIIRFEIDSALCVGNSFTVTFPEGTVVSDTASMMINATAGWVGDQYSPANFDMTTFTFSTVARTLTAVLGPGDQVGEGAEIRIEVLSGITNPSVEADYTLTVCTTWETVPVSSVPYTVSSSSIPETSVSQPLVSLENYQPGQESSYVIRFELNNALYSGDEIVVSFPEDTLLGTLGATIVATGGWLDGSYKYAITSGTIVEVDTPGRTLKVTLGANNRIGAGAEVRISIAGGITNPTIEAGYALSVQTTADTVPVLSGTYTITNLSQPLASVESPDVAVGFATVSYSSAYTISFDLLCELGGYDEITITFPEGTVLTAPSVTIQANEGWIDGQYYPAYLSGVSVCFNATYRTITLILGTADCIGEGANVRIKVNTGVLNPPEIGEHTLTVHTSEGLLPVESSPYFLCEPMISRLPGVVSMYNPAGILMNQWLGATAIQDALDSVPVPGCIVELSPGTYAEDPVIRIAGTEIRGSGSEDQIVVQGTWTTAFTNNTLSTEIKGLTLQPEYTGTHVMDITKDNVTIEDCRILKTWYPSSQVLIESSGDNLIVRNCDFDTSIFYVADTAILINNGSARIECCTFMLDESSDGEDDLGVIITSGSQFDITGCEFNGSSGCGVVTATVNGSIINCTFDNLDTGVLIQDAPAIRNVMNNEFVGNNYGIIVDADNCTIAGNIIQRSQKCSVQVTADVHDNIFIVNNTIADNTGKGISFDSQQDSNITNNILWNNGDDLVNCSTTYSNVSDGDPGEGNISQDPLFVDAANGDYHLQEGSPCIDAGGVIPVTLTEDIDYEARVNDGDDNGSVIIDMGADEYTELIANPLILEPSAIEFDGVILGDHLELSAQLTSNAVNVLHVTGAGRTSGSSEFTYVSPSVPFTINPGQSVPVTIRYTPVSESSADAVFVLTTDATGDLMMQLHADGYGVVMHYNPGGGIPGDADGNGIVNVLDISKIARIILGLE